MHLESVAHGTNLAVSTNATHEYYHLSRTRSGAAEVVLSAMSSLVSSVMVVRGMKRDELYEKYDLKLWSYDDNLAWFTLSTIPSAAVLIAAVRCASRGSRAALWSCGVEHRSQLCIDRAVSALVCCWPVPGRSALKAVTTFAREWLEELLKIPKNKRRTPAAKAAL